MAGVSHVQNFFGIRVEVVFINVRNQAITTEDAAQEFCIKTEKVGPVILFLCPDTERPSLMKNEVCAHSAHESLCLEASHLEEYLASTRRVDASGLRL
jgi:hypothetical protein